MYNGFMKDFLKEKISYYKLLLTFSITAFYGIVGWYSSKDFNIDNAMKMLMIFIIGFVSIGIGIFIYKIRFYLNELRGED